MDDQEEIAKQYGYYTQAINILSEKKTNRSWDWFNRIEIIQEVIAILEPPTPDTRIAIPEGPSVNVTLAPDDVVKKPTSQAPMPRISDTARRRVAEIKKSIESKYLPEAKSAVGATTTVPKIPIEAKRLWFLGDLREIKSDRWIFDPLTQSVPTVLRVLSLLGWGLRSVDNIVFYPPAIIDVYARWYKELNNVHPSLTHVEEKDDGKAGWRYATRRESNVSELPKVAEILRTLALTVTLDADYARAFFDAPTTILIPNTSPFEQLIGNAIAKRPRPAILTPAMIDYIIKAVLARLEVSFRAEYVEELTTKGGYIHDENWIEWQRDIENHLRMQLINVSLVNSDDARAVLVDQLSRTIAKGMARPGKAVGYEAVEAIMAQLTQVILKSYHKAGGAGTVSTGIKAAQEMINLPRVRADEKMFAHFKEIPITKLPAGTKITDIERKEGVVRLTPSQVLAKRQELVEINLQDLVNSNELMMLTEVDEKGVERKLLTPWWHREHEMREQKRWHDFAKNSKIILRLGISVVDCYRYRITMRDIARAIEKDNNCFLCVSSPMALGFIDVYVDETKARIDIVSRTKHYIEKGTGGGSSGCSTSGRKSGVAACQPGLKSTGRKLTSRKLTTRQQEGLQQIDSLFVESTISSIFLYFNVEIVDNLQRFVIQGIPRVRNLSVDKLAFWSIVNEVTSTPDYIVDGVYVMNLSPIRQRLSPIKLRQLEIRLVEQGIIPIAYGRDNRLVSASEVGIDTLYVLALAESSWVTGNRFIFRGEEKVAVGFSPGETKSSEKPIFIVDTRLPVVLQSVLLPLLGIKEVRQAIAIPSPVPGFQYYRFYLDNNPQASTKDWLEKKFGERSELMSALASGVVSARYDKLPESVRFYYYAVLKIQVRQMRDFKDPAKLREPLYELFKRRDIEQKYCYTNNIHRNYHALGWYAARTFQIREMYDLVRLSGVVDPRHVILVVDFLMSNGDPLPFTYTGAKKHNVNSASVMSFQRPLEQTKLAAASTLEASMESVSGSVFRGGLPRLGTGLVGPRFNPVLMERVRARQDEEKEFLTNEEEKDPLTAQAKRATINLYDDTSLVNVGISSRPDADEEFEDWNTAPELSTSIVIGSTTKG